MWRGASTTLGSLALVLLAACAGCSGAGTRRATSKELSHARADNPGAADQRAGPGRHRSARPGAGQERVAPARGPDPALGRGSSAAGESPPAPGATERGGGLLPAGAGARAGLCRGPDRAGEHRGRPARVSLGAQAIRDGHRDRTPRRRGPFRLRRGCSRRWAGPTRPLPPISGRSSSTRCIPRSASGSAPSSSRETSPTRRSPRLDQAVDLAPEDGEVRLLRGRAHLMLRHIPQAIADFRTAAQHLPDRADVYYQLAPGPRGRPPVRRRPQGRRGSTPPRPRLRRCPGALAEAPAVRVSMTERRVAGRADQDRE